MTIFFGILFVWVGVTVALLLNKFLADKIENKSQRRVLKFASYILFIGFSLLFALEIALKEYIDEFIDDKVYEIELSLRKNFPNAKVMEISINTKEFADMSGKLLQSLNDMGESSNVFYEKLVFDAFMSMLTPYINSANSGVNAIAAKGGKQGEITMKSILLSLKELASQKVSQGFMILEIILIILFLLCIFIYIVVAIFMRKSETSENKGIVFGEGAE